MDVGDNRRNGSTPVLHICDLGEELQPGRWSFGNRRKEMEHTESQISRKVPSPLTFWQTAVRVLNGSEEEGGEL